MAANPPKGRDGQPVRPIIIRRKKVIAGGHHGGVTGGAFNDGWGKEMTLSFEEKTGKTMVKYHSAGPDGVAGNDDDKVYADTIPY